MINIFDKLEDKMKNMSRSRETNGEDFNEEEDMK